MLLVEGVFGRKSAPWGWCGSRSRQRFETPPIVLCPLSSEPYAGRGCSAVAPGRI